jgi:hypothetical protein
VSAERPVFAPLDTGDLKLNRIQEAIAEALDSLESRLSAALTRTAVPQFAADFTVPTDATVVAYRGRGGHRGQLPPADAAGRGLSRPIYVLNVGPGTLTVTPAGRDTINGVAALALLTRSSLLAIPDGLGGWLAFRSREEAIPPLLISSEWYSPVLSAEALGTANIRNTAGNFTTGDKFSSTRALICTGVRFYWKANGANSYTVRVKIWKGTALATADVAVQASGVYTGTFAAPLELTAYNTYAATAWETTGARYTDVDATAAGPYGAVALVGGISTGPFTFAHSFQRHAAGDAVPVTTSSTNFYPVEPVFAPFELDQ